MADKQNHISVDEFLKNHSDAPLQVTIEASADSTKVRLTPWTASGGCNCGAALELPKSTIESVELAGDIHRCCGKALRVANVHFAATHAEILRGAFAALSAKSGHNHSEDVQHEIVRGNSKQNCTARCNEQMSWCLQHLDGFTKEMCGAQWRNCTAAC
jgi:hypothetical protein